MKIIILLLLPVITYAQIETNVLKKFSYPVIVYGENNCAMGTGFFYKNGTKSFYVSNYHVLKGWNCLNWTADFPIQYVEIIYARNDSGEKSSLRINYTKELSKIDSFWWSNQMDLFAIQIDSLPHNFKPNYINPLISNTASPINSAEVYIYGFPGIPQPNGCVYTDTFIQETIIDNFSKWYKMTKALCDSANLLKLNFAYPKLKENYYCISGLAESGCSGSPVWAKSKNGNSFYFMGVMFGDSRAAGHIWAIKPKQVIQYLQSLGSSKISRELQ